MLNLNGRGKDILVRKQVNGPKVFVIDTDGGKVGHMSNIDAVNLAKSKGLDLVEVSRNSKGAICKIMDYNKYRYDKKQKEKVAKKNNKKIVTKEIKFNFKIDKHDFDVKVSKIKRLLLAKNYVKVTMQFRGREIVYSDSGLELLKQVVKQVDEVGKLDGNIALVGNRLTMLIKFK